MLASELAEHLRVFIKRYGDRDVMTHTGQSFEAITFDNVDADSETPFVFIISAKDDKPG